MNDEYSSVLKSKRAAGFHAAEFIREGMLVGLGTGSTAAFFIEALGTKCREGLNIKAVATSKRSADQARNLGIPLESAEEVTRVDIVVDGADEIDSKGNMIKGGGGALLREKLLALSAEEMVVIVDETKVVDRLGSFPVPIEICPYLYRHTLLVLEQQGYQGSLRFDKSPALYTTDNGNYIFDIRFSSPILDPLSEHIKLKLISGVIETGLFSGLAGRIVVGYKNGSSKILHR